MAEIHEIVEARYGTDGDMDLARVFVDQCGAPATETNVLQMREYLRAFAVFLERNDTYEDLWKDYGWMDTLTHVRSKAFRLVRKFWRDDAPEDATGMLDDAYDLMNYSVFFIRNYMIKNKWGRV